MKRILTIAFISLVILSLPSLALAQGKQQGGNGVQQKIQDPTTHEDDTTMMAPAQGNPQGQQAGQMGEQQGNTQDLFMENRGIKMANENLNKVVERKNNPEIGEQVRVMIQNHEQIQTRTKTSLQKMSNRNQAVKFLIGPDYKNAGQVRSDVVGLRNDISQLEKIKEDATATDEEDIQTAIDELQVEADQLDAQLEEQLSGFSLFGWLARRFAN